MFRKVSIDQEDFDQEVLNRQGRIRYYSGFTLEGFFGGYDPKTRTFDKSKISPNKRVWFYAGYRLIYSTLSEEVVEIGSNEDYKNYYLNNLQRAPYSAIMGAAGRSLLNVGSYFHPNSTPCVFSGLISITEIKDVGGYDTWFASKNSHVQVDRLYEVEVIKQGLITRRRQRADIINLNLDKVSELLRTGWRLNLIDISERL